jgi:uncharacterized membrane protein YkgB
MNHLTNLLVKIGILKKDLDYHLMRASMVIIFFFFGYQKWLQYEAQALIPYISNGPVIFWLYPVFGIREGHLLFRGGRMVIWPAPVLRLLEQKIGNSRSSRWMFFLIATFTIIPFMPNGWAAPAGGFPAMTGNVAFLMKDVVFFAASFYLLKQDVVRASLSARNSAGAYAKQSEPLSTLS